MTKDYKEDVKIRVMEHPVSTIHGCRPGFHTIRIADNMVNPSYGEYGCGYGAFAWSQAEDVSSINVSYMNWLRDDWDVDRIIAIAQPGSGPRKGRGRRVERETQDTICVDTGIAT
jgi:hypothetical protein